MSKPPRDRSVVGSHTYFITASTWHNRPLFQSQRMAELFLDTAARYRQEGKFLLHGYVLMPTHFHLLLTPGPDVTLERAMQFIKGGFSYRAKRELGLNYEIWERGYVDHRIRDESDYEHHRKIHRTKSNRGRSGESHRRVSVLLLLSG